MVDIRTRIVEGADVSRRDLTSVSGRAIPVPDPDRLVHLQFRRFAGCPVCNLHLRSIALRHDDIVAAGVREVVVFHSPDEELRDQVADLPFEVVGDPDRVLYREFGVETSPRALLDPRVWPVIAVAVARTLWGLIRGTAKAPAHTPNGGRLGLPADFLIAPNGRVIACRYGEHAYDQWTPDQLLEHASGAVPR